MTVTVSDPCRCSDQDWALRIASFYQALYQWSDSRTDRNDNYSRFSQELHKAMGHRSDQREW